MFRLRKLIRHFEISNTPATTSAVFKMSTSSPEKYDLIVIGGGSGGMASARRAAQYGAKVVMFEEKYLGGTCVNVGCVPKKIMWSAASVAWTLRSQAPAYGFELGNIKLDFKGLKQRRDDYVQSLRDIYKKNLSDAKIVHVPSHGRFVAPKVIESVKDGRQYTADHIMLAVGGYPYIPDIPGKEYIYTSDDFFHKLDQLPRKVAVVGGGYIAVELVQVLKELGSEADLFIRGQHPLRKFDRLVQCGVHEALLHSGVNIHANVHITAIEKEEKENTLTLVSKEKGRSTGYDCVIYAIGRGPNEKELGLSKTSVKQDDQGFIISNEWEETHEKGVYALGDVNNKIALTPVAIRAGRKWADRIFGGQKDAKMDYKFVPTVIFSHPPIGTIGYTEEEVREMVKEKQIAGPVEVYEAHFRGLMFGVYKNQKDKEMTHFKLICVGQQKRVMGLHMIGHGCDEMLQGFSVAIKMGATKDDFDNATAIHPTASEEFVTMKIVRGEEDNHQYNCGTHQKADSQKSDKH